MNSAKIQHYRSEARRIRAYLPVIKDPIVREKLMEIVLQYEKLADDEEKQRDD